MTRTLVKAGANWVDGERFFNREFEIATLQERVRDGNHTLITAQRRVGKTSLVRELFRRLDEEGRYSTAFVDLESANDPGDAIAEIAIQSRPLENAWKRTRSLFANRLGDAINRIEEVGLSELKVKLRASIDAGNWQLSGDQVFEALSSSEKPVVLAIDELPILVNKLLKGNDFQVTPDRRGLTEEFLTWLRKNAQAHVGKITLIISGSVGLEPILRQAGLSAHANIYSPLELTPWDQDTAIDCLEALAQGYDVKLSADVKVNICDRLRCCIPHHVQQYFDLLHQHLRRSDRNEATLADVKLVYERDLLSVRGQIDLEHYEQRLRSMLGRNLYRVALDVLTEAAVNDGYLTNPAARLHREALESQNADQQSQFVDVVYALEHDGYIERHGNDYRFVSGLLEDWWRSRHGQYFTPIAER